MYAISMASLWPQSLFQNVFENTHTKIIRVYRRDERVGIPRLYFISLLQRLHFSKFRNLSIVSFPFSAP